MSSASTEGVADVGGAQSREPTGSPGETLLSRRLSFPRDHGLHKEALREWWYLNAHLTSQGGKSYGLVVAFFSDYMIFVLSDLTEKMLLCRDQVAGARLQSSPLRLDLRFGASAWRQSPESQNNSVVLCATNGTRASLRLEAVKPPLLVNGTGLIKEGLLGESWYYSQTSVRAEGELTINGRAVRVGGLAWVDRQWGTWEAGGLGGWDWFSMQFDNGYEGMAFRQKHPLTRRPVEQILNIFDPEGRVEVVRRFSLNTIETWRSPKSGDAYGCDWRVAKPGVIDVRIIPVFKDQEVHSRFWEGACYVRGSLHGNSVSGRGFAEQVDNTAGTFLGRLVLLGVAPLHYLGQRLLGREDLGIWDLLSTTRLLRKRASRA